MLRPSSVLVHGTIGGVLAGVVVALWFLVVDVALGEPLATPRLLATELIGGGDGVATPRLIAGYTFLHLGVFALIGAVCALALDALGIRPGLAVGLVIGLGVLDAVHYGALVVTGADLLTGLRGPNVLLANVAAGLTLGAYLHRALAVDGPLGPAVLREHPRLLRGLTTGLVGAFAVAVWFLVLDTVAGRPLYTPAALGSLVFLGAAGPGEVVRTLGTVGGYTLLHFLVFGVVGVAVLAAAEQIERNPSYWLMAFMALVVLEGVFLGAMLALGAWILGTMSWWAIGVGNIIAVAAMIGWVWETHPALRRALRTVPAETRL